MASELRLLGHTSGETIYATVTRDSDEKVWQTTTSSFVTRVNADHATYDVAMTETPSGSRIWLGDFPADISDDGTVLYHVDYYAQSGASPVHTDEILGGEQMYSDGSSGSSTPATSTLISVAEFDVAVPGNTYSASTKSFYIQSATAAMERYCGRKLLQETDREEVLDGTGFGYVQLGGVPSVVTTVTTGYQTDDEEEHDGANFSWTPAGLLYVKSTYDDLAYFPAGFRNVHVTYTSSGTVDYDLKGICAALAHKMIQRTGLNNNVAGKTVGSVKIDFRQPVYANLEDPYFGDIALRLQPFKAILCI
jgi:hypothetical protein